MKYLFLLLAVCLIPVSAQAEMHVSRAQAFASTAVQKNGAAFLSLQNKGDAADDLVAASVSDEIAERVELHTHIQDGDVMKMRAVERFAIPAGGDLRMEPMGAHIMLMGLKSPLTPGQSFPMVLSFDKAGEQTVNVEIVKPGDLSHNGH